MNCWFWSRIVSKASPLTIRFLPSRIWLHVNGIGKAAFNNLTEWRSIGSPQLEFLVLQFNKLTEFEDQELTRLKILDLSGNPIQRLRIANLQQLESLLLSTTQV